MVIMDDCMEPPTDYSEISAKILHFDQQRKAELYYSTM